MKTKTSIKIGQGSCGKKADKLGSKQNKQPIVIFPDTSEDGPAMITIYPKD